MKKFRWILLSGLLVATAQIAQAQAPGAPGAPVMPGSSAMNNEERSLPGAPGAPGGTADAGAITNTTTTTTTSGVAPNGSTTGAFVAPDDAASDSTSADSSMPNTGGEPMIAVLAGLSIAGAAVAMRRKVAA